MAVCLFIFVCIFYLILVFGVSKTTAQPSNQGSKMNQGSVIGTVQDGDEALSNFRAISSRTGTNQGDVYERLEYVSSKLLVKEEKLVELTNSFASQLKKGLEMHMRHPNDWIPEVSDFKMLDSCVPSIPTGKEKGLYYALDFGGSNIRVIGVDLNGQGRAVHTPLSVELRNKVSTSNPDHSLLHADTKGSELFDVLAQSIKQFIEKDAIEKSGNGLKNHITPIPLGFTFSFPAKQKGIASAELMQWTKEFETGRNCAYEEQVENRDVGMLLDEALRRHDVPAKIMNIINDGVGTLLCCAYEKPSNTPPCTIGLILGSGSNGCYVEPDFKKFGYSGKIINIEFGNFKQKLPLWEVDLEVDKASPNRGFQLFEKLISGVYIGEIVRRTILFVFQKHAPIGANIPNSLSAKSCMIIQEDQTKDLLYTKDEILTVFGSNLQLHELEIIKKIATLVLDRSAAMAAVAIGGILQHTKVPSEGVTVGVDGSLYSKNKIYANAVRQFLSRIVGEEIGKKTHFRIVDDGSGKGAAILAATLANLVRI